MQTLKEFFKSIFCRIGISSINLYLEIESKNIEWHYLIKHIAYCSFATMNSSLLLCLAYSDICLEDNEILAIFNLAVGIEL